MCTINAIALPPPPQKVRLSGCHSRVENTLIARTSLQKNTIEPKDPVSLLSPVRKWKKKKNRLPFKNMKPGKRVFCGQKGA